MVPLSTQPRRRLCRLARGVPADQRLLGPIIGGAIVSFASRRWIFLVNIPLGAIAALIAHFLLETDEPAALLRLANTASPFLVPQTPHWAIFAVLFTGGLLTSPCMVSLNTIGFVDVPEDRTAHATALVAMALLAAVSLIPFSRLRPDAGAGFR